MNERQLGQVLKRLVTDIGRSTSHNLILDQLDKKGRRFKLRIQPSSHRKQEVFCYPKIRPKKGCLVLTTWEKCLKNVDKSRIPHWEFREAYMFGEDGRRFEYCGSDHDVYEEAVYALTAACRYCLQ